jgi:hypothetical protein
MAFGFISDYLEAAMLNHVLGLSAYSAPASVKLGLHPGAPLPSSATLGAGGASEVAAGEYARIDVAWGAVTLDSSIAIARATNIDRFWDVQVSDWNCHANAGSGSDFNALLLYDALTGGNLLAWGAASMDAAPNGIGYAVGFPQALADPDAYAIRLSIGDGSSLSAYTNASFLRHLLGEASWTMPDPRLSVSWGSWPAGGAFDLAAGTYLERTTAQTPTWSTSMIGGSAVAQNSSTHTFAIGTSGGGYSGAILILFDNNNGNLLGSFGGTIFEPTLTLAANDIFVSI